MKTDSLRISLPHHDIEVDCLVKGDGHPVVMLHGMGGAPLIGVGTSIGLQTVVSGSSRPISPATVVRALH